MYHRAMLVHPNFNPVAISIGPLAIRWYGIMYLIGFGLFFFLGRYRARHDAWRGVSYELIDDMLFFGVLGVVLGGRLGYVLFYKPGYYFTHPAELVAVWQGGMSFHGGFLGVLVAVWLAARKHHLPFWKLTDFLAPLVPLGLAAGRMGNFINGELYGRVTDVPWGMVFSSPGAGPQPRHPSQLYEFALEGVVLFLLLWIYSIRRRPVGAVSGAFLIGYGAARCFVEFFREPDDFLGLLALGLSMGQWLSLPMILAGIGLMAWAYSRDRASRTAPWPGA
jgi:phosphatidylglycerol:prolipoprotein diacylglycerol transferase